MKSTFDISFFLHHLVVYFSFYFLLYFWWLSLGLLQKISKRIKQNFAAKLYKSCLEVRGRAYGEMLPPMCGQTASSLKGSIKTNSPSANLSPTLIKIDKHYRCPTVPLVQ